MISLIWTVISKFRKLFSRLVNERILKCYYTQKMLNSSSTIGITNRKYVEESEVIVSLTSYSKRVDEVYLVIESLMNQTYLANRIILWLNEPYCQSNIPQSLVNLSKRGLQIEYVEDYKSFDKLIHCIKKYPNDIIITVDDDILYSYDFIELLIRAYLKRPNSIHYLRGHRITCKTNGNINPYTKWRVEEASYAASKKNFFTSGAGTLFPPKSLCEKVTDVQLFQKLCPSADDIWFWAMAILQGTPFYRVKIGMAYFDKMTQLTNSQDIALYNLNVIKNKNDVQLKKVIDFFSIDINDSSKSNCI